MPFLYKLKVFWPHVQRVQTRLLIAFSYRLWNSWLRQQISKIPSLYKVSLSFRWNDEGKQTVKTKEECFKAWRLFLVSSLFLSNQWDFVASCATTCFEARFAQFWEFMSGRLVESLALCLQRRSPGKWKKNDTNIQLSWPNKLGQKRVYLFYGQVTVVLTHSGLSCCYLVTYE